MVTPRETAATLSRRAQAARERNDAEAAALAVVVRRCVPALLPAGARAWIIGSLAWGGFGERSDIDLVVDGIGEGAVSRLATDVERQVGREVDALELASLPRSFQERVVRDGVPLRGG